MIERLTNNNEFRFVRCSKSPNCVSKAELRKLYNEVYDALYQYECDDLSPEEVQEFAKAKAEGRLVELPCNVGGTVYEPFAGKVYEKTVDRIIINRFTTPQIWIETKLPFATPRLERWDMAFGKTVFLTREEAEKALGGAEE